MLRSIWARFGAGLTAEASMVKTGMTGSFSRLPAERNAALTSGPSTLRGTVQARLRRPPGSRSLMRAILADTPCISRAVAAQRVLEIVPVTVRSSVLCRTSMSA